MSGKNRNVCMAILICLTVLCLGAPLLYPSVASAAEFAISSGNYGWHIYGDTTGDPDEAASVNINVFFKNASGTVSVNIYDDNNKGVHINNSDFTLGSRYIQLKPAFLATLPIGTYRMDLSCAAGTVTAYFYIIKARTIIFAEQPQTVTIDKGDNATFTVAVSGSSGYSYQWQRRSRTGWKNVKGGTKRTLTLRKVPAYMCGYHYRCLVHSKAGDAYSATARVFINNVPATGDASNPWMYTVCASVSLLGMAGCAVGSKRKGLFRRK